MKLAVFDLEGTVFRNRHKGAIFPSIWKVLCKICGPDAAREDAKNTENYLNGGYSDCYSSWVLDTLKILKNYGLKRHQFDEVISDIEYYPGVKKTFDTLRQQDILIAIISGGLKALADRVIVDYQIDHCFAAAEIFWNQDDTIRHWNLLPTDFSHKRSLLEILCRDLGINARDCLFVGDGRNDRDIASFCALSIGFNPHQELRDGVDIIIEQPQGLENLSSVLEPIIKHPNYALSDFKDYKVWNETKDIKPEVS